MSPHNLTFFIIALHIINFSVLTTTVDKLVPTKNYTRDFNSHFHVVTSQIKMNRDAEAEPVAERVQHRQQEAIGTLIKGSFSSACLCCVYYYSGKAFTPDELERFGRQAGRLSHTNVLFLGINGVANYIFPSTVCSSTNTGFSCFTFIPLGIVLGLIASILEYAANQGKKDVKDRQQNQNQAVVLPNVLQHTH